MIKRIIIPTVAAGLVFAAAGLNNKLKHTEYVIESDKVEKQVNLVFLSDIHSVKYKDGGKELFRLIDSAKPDCILLGGDIFHKRTGPEEYRYIYELIGNLMLKYSQCYFITGNHEFTGGNIDEIKKKFSEMGVGICGDESFVFTAQNSQSILIGGTDNEKFGEELVLSQKEKLINRSKECGLFTVLLRHVPMAAEGDENFDLILSGHNHGGLWRLPKTDIGAIGGGNQLFPKYVHGKYDVYGTPMIVGSGVIAETYGIPRLYNQPEVVSVSVIPK